MSIPSRFTVSSFVPIFGFINPMIKNVSPNNTKTNLKTSFIPLASQQVFSKYFSPNVNQMLKWGIADRDAYKKALINCFNKYGIQLNHIGMGGE